MNISVGEVWQGADCGGAFSRPGICRDEKYSGLVSPSATRSAGKMLAHQPEIIVLDRVKKVTIQEGTILYEHSRI